MEILTKLQKLGFKIGSTAKPITTEYKKNGELIKIPNLPAGWNSMEPKITNNKQSFYLRTGTFNDLFVLDLDNMDNDDNKKLKKLADKCASVKVKTRKGYHYYFKYDSDFPLTILGNSFGLEFDILSDNTKNGSCVFCPPTVYYHHETNEKYEYKLVKCDKLTPISEELKKYIKELYSTSQKSKVETPKSTTSHTVINMESNTTDIVKKLINCLKPSRSIQFDTWMRASFCLKNSGYDSSYFHYFSGMYYKKYDKEEVEHFYKSLKPKNETERKLTIGTMWTWLLEDNEEAFKALKMESLNEKLKIDIQDDEHFDYEKFLSLVESDNKDLKEDYNFLFEYSRSYQYFNHFHVYHVSQNTVYRIDGEAPIKYSDNFFPNAIVGSRYGKKCLNFDAMYLRSKHLKLIENFEFDPNPKREPNKQMWNLFNGFKYKKVKYTNDDVEPFLTHVKNLMNNEETQYKYVLKWFSRIFQFPHRKSRVALIFYSEQQGSGKNITLNIVGKLLGKYYYQMQSADDFDARFNSQLQNKLLIVGDEVNARVKEKANELKNIISKEVIDIEYKGKDKYTIADYSNYGFTTNNENVFKIELTDRRMAIFHCSEKKILPELKNKLVDILESDILLNKLYSYFLDMDLSEFDVEDIPMTEYKTDLIEMDLPAYIKMIKDDIADFRGHKFSASYFYKRSLDYAKSNSLVRTYTERKCSVDISKLLSEYKSRESTGIFYTFPDDDSLPEKINKLIKKYIKERTTKID